MKVPFTVDCDYSVGTGEQLQHLHSKCVSEGEIECPEDLCLHLISRLPQYVWNVF